MLLLLVHLLLLRWQQSSAVGLLVVHRLLVMRLVCRLKRERLHVELIRPRRFVLLLLLLLLL